MTPTQLLCAMRQCAFIAIQLQSSLMYDCAASACNRWAADAKAWEQRASQAYQLGRTCRGPAAETTAS